MVSHTKEFGIYHWDTFDNETLLVGEADTITEAVTFIKDKYGKRIRLNGADQVEVVDLAGNGVKRFNVGQSNETKGKALCTGADRPEAFAFPICGR